MVNSKNNKKDNQNMRARRREYLIGFIFFELQLLCNLAKAKFYLSDWLAYLLVLGFGLIVTWFSFKRKGWEMMLGFAAMLISLATTWSFADINWGRDISYISIIATFLVFALSINFLIHSNSVEV